MWMNGGGCAGQQKLLQALGPGEVSGSQLSWSCQFADHVRTAPFYQTQYPPSMMRSEPVM
jgi:hypothetical protein